MPVVPEKLTSRQEVRNAMASQFWEQPVQSTRCIDGLARQLPGEPTPLSQTASSGLSRHQQLVVYQSLGIPFFPSYSEANGGVVLDRVLGTAGSRTWWLALGSRTRAQRLWQQCKDGLTKKQAFSDAHNYGLSVRGRMGLGRETTLNGVVEVPDAQQLLTLGRHAYNGQWREAAATARSPNTATSRVWLKQSLPGHDLRAAVAWQADALDSAACYVTTPLSCSIDLATKERNDGLQYQVGLHKVSAPAVESNNSPALTAATADPSTTAAAPWHSSLHFQGSVAVEGEAILWRPSGGAPPLSPPDTPLLSEGAPDAEQDVGPGVPPAPSPSGVEAMNDDAEFNDLAAALHAPGSRPSVPPPGTPPTASSVRTVQAKDDHTQAALTADVAGHRPHTCRRVRRRTDRWTHVQPLEELHRSREHLQQSEQQQRLSEHMQHVREARARNSSHSAECAASAIPAHGLPLDSTAANWPSTEMSGSTHGLCLTTTTPGRATAAGLQSQLRVHVLGEDGTLGPPSANAHHVFTSCIPAGADWATRTEMAHESCTLTVDMHEDYGGARREWRGRGGGAAGQAPSQAFNIRPVRHNTQASAALQSCHLDPLQSCRSLPAPAWQHAADLAAVSEAVLNPVAQASSALRDVQKALETFSPALLQQSMKDAVRQVEQLRGNIGALKGELQGYVNQLHVLVPPKGVKNARKGGIALPRPPPRGVRRPYSPFLAEPFIKMNAAMGCLARIPLPTSAFPLSGLTEGPGPSGPSQSLMGLTHQKVMHMRDKLVEAWTPYLRDTSLRVFASGSLSAQLGSFTRPVLDYTSACMRLDLGLTSMDFESAAPFKDQTVAQGAGARPVGTSSSSHKHRAFALEGRGSWHALSISMAQQVVGPIRARVDVRYALDPTADRQALSEGMSWAGLLRMVGSVRPSLLETVYGMDCVVPGSEGAARLALWYSPMRKEARAEMRLF